MKVLEFDTKIPLDGKLTVPPEIAAQVAHDNKVHVVLVVDGPSEDDAWRRLTAERFAAGYSESDAIYDDL